MRRILFVDFKFDLVVLADKVVEPLVSVLCSISIIRVEKILRDAVFASIAALSTNRIDHFRVVVRFAFLPLPRTTSVLFFVVQTRVDCFAARLDEISFAAAFAHCDFARSFV